MSNMNIQVPDSLLKQAREMAEKEEMTVEQLINSALAEKMAAWRTVEYLNKRAARSNQEKFNRALGKVPETEPEAFDRLQ